MTTKTIDKMNIGDIFFVEYGAYGNWTKAVIVDINRETNEVEYLIPHYCGDEIHKRKIYRFDVRG